MKAILVIDIDDEYLGKEISLIKFTDDNAIYCNTKLKPMPQRKIVGEIEKVNDFMKPDIQIINEKVTAKMMLDTELLLASGYNKCIDEILGEEE